MDMNTIIGFCIQAGQALAFDQLLAEAAGAVLEEGVPLIYSLLSGVVKHLPDEIPEKKEIRRMRVVANSVNLVSDHDSEWVRMILEEVGGANDGSWSLLPYLFAAFMTSNIWSSTAFNVDIGGFNNNIHCLAKCISAVIAGSEFVRLEREHHQKSSISNRLRKGRTLNNPGSVYVDCGILDLAADCYINALKIQYTRAHHGVARVHFLKNDKTVAYLGTTKLIEKARNNASACEKRFEYCERELTKAGLEMVTRLDPLRVYPYRYRAAGQIIFLLTCLVYSSNRPNACSIQTPPTHPLISALHIILSQNQP